MWRERQKKKLKNFEKKLIILKENFEHFLDLKNHRIRLTETLLSKSIYKLMINQSINFNDYNRKFKEKIENFQLKKAKNSDDKIFNKVLKPDINSYFKKKFDEIRLPNFENIEKALIKISEAMKNKGVELSECDISDLNSTKRSDYNKKGTLVENESFCSFDDDSHSIFDQKNESFRFNSMMILGDLEQNLSTRESSIVGIIENISDMKSKLKSPSIIHNAKFDHIQHLIESVKGLVEVLKITAQNLGSIQPENSLKNSEKRIELSEGNRVIDILVNNS